MLYQRGFHAIPPRAPENIKYYIPVQPLSRAGFIENCFIELSSKKFCGYVKAANFVALNFLKITL